MFLGAVPIGEINLSVRVCTQGKGEKSVSMSDPAKSWVLWEVSALGRARWHGPSSVRTPSDRGPSAFPAKVKISAPQDSIGRGLALIPEERRTQGLVGNESVRKNITLACLKKKFCVGPSWIKQDKEVEAVRDSIVILGIATPSTEQETQFLSGGTQQKVVVGKWLMSDSDIYIFDEPTKGIDVGGKYDIYKIIVDLARQGAGIIFISNELTEILSLCDRICDVSP
jgi:ABC-type sugar transport system ATPase subunit